SFIGLAITTMVFGIVVYLLLGRRIGTKRAEQRMIDGHDKNNKLPFTPVRLRHLVVFLIVSTFNHAVILSIIAFIPLFMIDNFGIGKETAAILLAIIYSAGLWASPLGGYLSDRFGDGAGCTGCVFYCRSCYLSAKLDSLRLGFRCCSALSLA
ncbi:MFS transporter, partial [Chloroflexota bacterium]